MAWDFPRRPEEHSWFATRARVKSLVPAKLVAQGRAKLRPRVKPPVPVKLAAKQRAKLLVRAQAHPLRGPELPLLSKLSRRAAPHFGQSPVRDDRHSPDQDPCAFCLTKPADRKCNRAVRCGVRPICVPSRTRRNRRGPVAYDNSCSRSRHRCDARVPPCRIAAGDKHRSRLPPFAARDDRSANLEQR